MAYGKSYGSKMKPKKKVMKKKKKKMR